MPSREEQYPLGDDGLVVEKVGAWAKTKHKLLTDYIQASGGARSNYISAAARLTSTSFVVPAVCSSAIPQSTSTAVRSPPLSKV